MIFIIAGDEQQAKECADIKGLGRDEWKRVGGLNELRGTRLAGVTVYGYGTFRTRHMFEWREMLDCIKHHGGKFEQVIDGRLTG